MSEQKNIELILQIQMEESDREELDFQTRHLLKQIRAEDVESAGLASGPPEAGTKAIGAVEIGAIVVELGPLVLPTLLGIVSSWMRRDQGRSVKFKGMVNGKMVEFEGNPDDFERMLAMLKRVEAKDALVR